MRSIYNNNVVLEQLKTAVKSGKLHHANLIHSGPGEAALPIALYTAQLLLCSDQTACGTCSSCKRVASLQHPDLTLSFPFISGGNSGTSDDFIKDFREAYQSNPYLDPNSWQERIATKNQQLQIPVKEIQSIHHKLSLTAAEGKYRILLLWMPENIRLDASNKLLKLIEEPLNNTYIILATHDRGRLLPTITSRCAPWQCRPFQGADFFKHFANAPKHEVKLLALIYAPNLGAALHAIQQNTTTELDLFAQWMRSCYRGQAVEISDRVDELSALSKESLKSLLKHAQHFLERGFYYNAQQLSTDATDLGVINVQKLSAAVTPRGALTISNALEECIYDLQRNVHTKTSLTYASYQLHSAFRGN